MMAGMANRERNLDRVAEYVRTRRSELGLTQQQLAERAEVDTGTVSSLERSRAWPRTRNRARLEKALGWKPQALERISHGQEPIPDEPPKDTDDRRYEDPALQRIWDIDELPETVRRGMIAYVRAAREEEQRAAGE